MTFYNQIIDKKGLKRILSWFLENYGPTRTSELIEYFKTLGFHYATKAGLSLGFDDLRIPATKNPLLEVAQKQVQNCEKSYLQGSITALERYQKLIDIWTTTSENLKDEVIQNFQKTPLNPLYMMAFSGARGNISQVRQLVGMRGLMSDSGGGIIDFPIRSNFREGLSVTEYVISCYGARKGLIDTALRTADSGYLTRRLVDVAHGIIIREVDCFTKASISVPLVEKIILGRVLAENLFSPQLVGFQSFENSFFAWKNQDISWSLSTEILTRLGGSYSQADFVRRLPIDLPPISPERLAANRSEALRASDRFCNYKIDRKQPDMLRKEIRVRSPLTCDGIGMEPAKSAAANPLKGDWPKPPFGPEAVFSRAANLPRRDSPLRNRIQKNDSFRYPLLGEGLVREANHKPDVGSAREFGSSGVGEQRLRQKNSDGICQLCYGWNLSQGRLVSIGDAVGVLAAQSIGEPGTQLTMRTFHTGGIFSTDVQDKIFAPHDGFISFRAEHERKLSLDFWAKGCKVRSVHGETGFLSFEPIQLEIHGFQNGSGFSKRKDFVSILQLPAQTLLFVYPGKYVQKNTLCAEISRVRINPASQLESMMISGNKGVKQNGQLSKPPSSIQRNSPDVRSEKSAKRPYRGPSNTKGHLASSREQSKKSSGRSLFSNLLPTVGRPYVPKMSRTSQSEVRGARVALPIDLLPFGSVTTKSNGSSRTKARLVKAYHQPPQREGDKLTHLPKLAARVSELQNENNDSEKIPDGSLKFKNVLSEIQGQVFLASSLGGVSSGSMAGQEVWVLSGTKFTQSSLIRLPEPPSRLVRFGDFIQNDPLLKASRSVLKSASDQFCNYKIDRKRQALRTAAPYSSRNEVRASGLEAEVGDTGYSFRLGDLIKWKGSRPFPLKSFSEGSLFLNETPAVSDRFAANLPGEIGGSNYKIDRKRKHYALPIDFVTTKSIGRSLTSQLRGLPNSSGNQQIGVRPGLRSEQKESKKLRLWFPNGKVQKRASSLELREGVLVYSQEQKILWSQRNPPARVALPSGFSIPNMTPRQLGNAEDDMESSPGLPSKSDTPVDLKVRSSDLLQTNSPELPIPFKSNIKGRLGDLIRNGNQVEYTGQIIRKKLFSNFAEHIFPINPIMNSLPILSGVSGEAAESKNSEILKPQVMYVLRRVQPHLFSGLGHLGTPVRIASREAKSKDCSAKRNKRNISASNLSRGDWQLVRSRLNSDMKAPAVSDRLAANLALEVGGPNYKIDRKRKHYASRITSPAVPPNFVGNGVIVQEREMIFQLSLPVEQSKTGDIVQGLPKIEQLFEGRGGSLGGESTELDIAQRLPIDFVTTKLIGSGSATRAGQKGSLGTKLSKQKNRLPPDPSIPALAPKKSGSVNLPIAQKAKRKRRLLPIDFVTTKLIGSGSATRAGRIKRAHSASLNREMLSSKKESITPEMSRQATKYLMYEESGELSSGSVGSPDPALQRFILQRRLVDEIQSVYQSQGVEIADKHVELIVRQMTSKVRILEKGNTPFFADDIVDFASLRRINPEHVLYEPVILGITKASLFTDSYVSAASFQETKRVLIDAALQGRVDFLTGLKENVIVGRLIPAGTGQV